ncbi:flagellar protein FlaG [Rhodoferax sp.]|uniref:flagellar protein FlaG n=1 Tax=Rhodoferax sp. TaxID=50421 RepID=UPI00284D910E|nr:flagellar protein FlaG [Rhodoferax sp.]MDR3369150.1 flagellar protein FlaG [Rhodoferax sp.]
MSTFAVSGAALGQLPLAVRQVADQTQPVDTTQVANIVAEKQASSSQTQPGQPSANSNANLDDLEKLVSDIQSKVPVASKDLRFSVDQDSGKSVVTLTDRATKEVLWQVPSEVALRISKELDKYQKGALVNRRV